MFVYVIVCNESLKLYVGQHKGDDLGKYLTRKFWDANHHTSGTRSHLYAAMRKYTRDSWSIHPLISGIESKVELDELERLLIYATKAQHPDIGYNICDGGEGGNAGGAKGCHHSLESSRNAHLHYANREQWKLNQSQSHKGRPCYWQGKKFSDEHRENLRKSHPHVPWSTARRAAQENRSTI